MDSKKLALLCRALAENKKAESIAVLDVRKVSGITDYFVIATGTSEPHLRAIVDEIADKLREDHGVRPRAAELHGLRAACRLSRPQSRANAARWSQWRSRNNP